jgi:phage gp36-like protein
MTYATQSQLEARYGLRMLIDCTDRGDVATGVVDTSVVAAALGAADSVIDGYLLGTYALPLASVPALVSDIACAIAMWRLSTGVPGDKIKADYDDARKTLEQISRGVVKLSVSGLPAATSGTSGALVTDRERPFSADQMTGFI